MAFGTMGAVYHSKDAFFFIVDSFYVLYTLLLLRDKHYNLLYAMR